MEMVLFPQDFGARADGSTPNESGALLGEGGIL